MKYKNVPTIDCRSDEGITVDLIDAIIVTAKQLGGRSLRHPAIREALKDLRSTPELKVLLEKKKS